MKMMVMAIIFLFMLMLFLLFLHLYAKWFWWRSEQALSPPPPRSSSTRRHRRLVFAPHQDPERRGLDISVLTSLPVVTFQSQELEEGSECAVCLSELSEGDKARLLPNCNHGFHVDCIDMWFQSHSTCPLCRSSVAPLLPQDACSTPSASTSNMELQCFSDHETSVSHQSPNFPTNVLYWGDQTQVSVAAAAAAAASCLENQATTSLSPSFSLALLDHEMQLVIDVPVHTTENFANEESKSPTTSRLRSLKRLLSREKRVAPSSFGTSSAEV